MWESTGFVVCTSDPLFWEFSLTCVLQPFSPFHQSEGVEESQNEADVKKNDKGCKERITNIWFAGDSRYLISEGPCARSVLTPTSRPLVIMNPQRSMTPKAKSTIDNPHQPSGNPRPPSLNQSCTNPSLSQGLPPLSAPHVLDDTSYALLALSASLQVCSSPCEMYVRNTQPRCALLRSRRACMRC